MSFENQDKKDQEQLDNALASLKRSIEIPKENREKIFETPNGSTVQLIENSGMLQLFLTSPVGTAEFLVTEESLAYHDTLDVDGQKAEFKPAIEKLKAEAQELFEAGLLTLEGISKQTQLLEQEELDI